MEMDIFSEVVKCRRIYAPKLLNIDELCFLWFVTKLRLPTPVEIDFVDSLENLPLDQAFVIGFEGFLSIHQIPPGQSLCKLFYRDYLKHREMFELPASQSLIQLVDYCTRAVRKKLNEKEKQPGSLVHVIYTLRSFGVEPRRLLEVFDYLASRILAEPAFLSTMCDIELDVFDSTLSKYLYEADKARQDIIARHVVFRYAKSFFVAVNATDHNVAKFIFEDFPMVKIYLFASPSSNLMGVIVRKGFRDFNLNELYELILKAEKNPEVKWIKRGNTIINSFGRMTNKQSSLTLDDLLNFVFEVCGVGM